MKKRLLALFALYACVGWTAFGAVTYVQSCGATSGSPDTCTLTGVASGDVLYISAQNFNTATAVLTDNGTPITAVSGWPKTWNAGGGTTYLWAVPSASAGSHALTVTWASGSFHVLGAVELAGVGTAPTDSASNFTEFEPTGGARSCTSLTTSTNSELLASFEFQGSGNTNVAPDAGTSPQAMTKVAITGSGGIVFEYGTAATAGSNSVQWVMNDFHMEVTCDTIAVLDAGSSPLAQPTFSPTPGPYLTTQNVVITPPAGATACYRTDGVTPTAPTPGTCGAGSTTYTGPISTPTTTTFLAIATKAGSINSSVASGAYRIGTQTWYVGPDGGTRYSSNMTSGQCDGLADVGYPGTGVNQHCRFNDVRYLWQDGSYNIPATFPSWGWIGAGGDTYIIDCSGALNASCRIGWQNPNTALDPTLGEYRGLQGDAFNSGAPPPFSGTSGVHTRILGKNYAACTSPAAKTKLNGGYGVNFAMTLAGTDYVDLNCLDITDNSGCSVISTITHCQTSTPLDDYIGIAGIQLYKTSTHDTLTDIYIHGTAKDGLFGSTGDGTSLNRVTVTGNPYTGWDADPADGTTGTGNLSLTNFHTLFSGCEEGYPITTTSVLAIEGNQTITVGQVGDCHDQTHGGQGDGIGTATVISSPAWHVSVASSTAAYNTQDGFDLLHLQGNGSSLVLKNSLAYGNMGQQIKSGALSDVYNNLIVANVNAWRTLPGQAAGANTALSDYGRAGDTGVLIYVQDGTTTRFAYNTLYSANAVALEIGNNGCTVGTGSTCLLDYENNAFVGFLNNTTNGYPAGGNGQLPNLNFIDSANPFLNTGSVYSHNSTYHGLNPCPYTANGEVNALCVSPGLVDETWHLYGIGDMQIASTMSSIYQQGIALGGITTDYLGTSRLTPPSMSAFELGGGTPTAATPTFSPNGATSSSAIAFTIATASSGAIICQSNSVTPATDHASGCTAGTLYTGTITAGSTGTWQAVAGGTGYLDSSVSSATFTVNPQAATPVWTPTSPHNDTAPFSASIAESTGGAIVCWSATSAPVIAGSSSCPVGSTHYVGAFTINVTGNYHAVAGGPGLTDSAESVVAYTITVGSPDMQTGGPMILSGNATVQ